MNSIPVRNNHPNRTERGLGEKETFKQEAGYKRQKYWVKITNIEILWHINTCPFEFIDVLFIAAKKGDK